MVHGNFDFHSDLAVGLDLKFVDLNAALKAFVSEMKSQKRWDDVTIVVTSDFGRYAFGQPYMFVFYHCQVSNLIQPILSVHADL